MKHIHPPGFEKNVIRPATPGDLTWVKVVYKPFYGKIESHWTRAYRHFTPGCIRCGVFMR